MTFSVNNYYYITSDRLVILPLTQTRRIKYKHNGNMICFEDIGRYYTVDEDLFQNRYPYKICTVQVIGKMLTNSVDYWDGDWGSNMFLMSVINNNDGSKDGLIIPKPIILDKNYCDQHLTDLNPNCWLKPNTHVSDINFIQKNKLHNLEWVGE